MLYSFLKIYYDVNIKTTYLLMKKAKDSPIEEDDINFDRAEVL